MGGEGKLNEGEEGEVRANVGSEGKDDQVTDTKMRTWSEGFDDDDRGNEWRTRGNKKARKGNKG